MESRDLNYDDLVNNETLKRAVVKSLEIIGEATKNLSEDFRKSNLPPPTSYNRIYKSTKKRDKKSDNNRCPSFLKNKAKLNFRERILAKIKSQVLTGTGIRRQSFFFPSI